MLRLQLLGLDYLVDSDLVPWLLEVNGTPSLVGSYLLAAQLSLQSATLSLWDTKQHSVSKLHMCRLQAVSRASESSL